ncbi:MAG: alpha-amylase, partial [Deltaproteobacteria bacterium]|nr:alpha-amylase [Deltaproteobacteria bacterium]
NATTNPWKVGDTYLDWYGKEAGQSGWSNGSHAEGTPADWTTNRWPSSWGPMRTVLQDGYGYEPLNAEGMHYWMLDVDMDCSKGHVTAGGTAWFELKTFISGGPGWEPDVVQAGAPYRSGNHFAKCGMVNVFRRGSNEAVFRAFR